MSRRTSIRSAFTASRWASTSCCNDELAAPMPAAQQNEIAPMIARMPSLLTACPAVDRVSRCVWERGITMRRNCIGLAALLLAYGSSAHAVARIDDAALEDESNTADWLAYGRTQTEQRFSPLKAIDTTNVGSLGVAWYRDLPNDNGLVATPLVANGVMYFTGTGNV